MITINNSEIIAFNEWFGDVRGLVKNIIVSKQPTLHEDELSASKKHIVQATQTKAFLTRKSVK